MSDETSAFDAARKAFAGAQQAMETAAIAELGRIIHETHPHAVEAHTNGEYTDGGDLSIALVAIKTLAGLVDDFEVIEPLDEAARDALRYLIVTMDEGYLGEQEITLSTGDETCLGFLLEQSYGTAAIPEDWTPVQACDDCQKFESDEDAANAAAQAIVFEGLAPGGCEVKYFPGVRSEDSEDDYEPPGDWAVRPNAEVPR